MRKILSMFLALSIFTAPNLLGQTHSQLLPIEKNNIGIFERIGPLVVNVHKLRTVILSGYLERDIRAGTASGFIWNKDGYVVTNFHVIRGANKLAVTLEKGRTVRAQVVGALPRKDIAVLKITDSNALQNISGSQHFPIADSAHLKVGQQAIAIGNPFGLDRTMTSGIISAVGREIPGVAGRINNMIQTDASINPGNSGGPLLDSSGRLIGMNTAIFSSSGSSAGIGFAVPANDIKRIVQQIIQYGRVKQAGIGVQIFSDQIAKALGVQGVVVSGIVDGTPAHQAGLRGTHRDQNGHIHLGDIIVEINGNKVKNYEDLNDVMDKIKIGERVKVKYQRNNNMAEVEVQTVDLQ